MKKRLLYLPIFLMTMSLCGCSPQLTTQNYTHEAGESLPTEVTAYATFEKPEKAAEAVLNMDTVDPNKVGTYEAVITLKNKEYPFTVEVVDTRAPEGTFSTLVAVAGIDDKVTAEAFQLIYTDVSEVSYGIRNAKIVKTETELKEMFGVLQQSETGGEVRLDELLGLTWNSETDTWDEKDISKESISEGFVPEESGLYCVDVVAADSSGNADVINCYVLADLEAPVFKNEMEIDITLNKEYDPFEFMEIIESKLCVEDNILGDISNLVAVEGIDSVEEKNGIIKQILPCSVVDFVGNETSANIISNLKHTVKNTVSSPGSESSEVVEDNGYERARAEEAFARVNEQRVAAGIHALEWDESMYAFACERASQIVSNFSHNLPDGTDTADYLLYVVGGAYGYGENIASNYKSINNLINGWMNSPSHKKTILDSRYTYGVMGCYKHNGSYYWVNLFKAK